MSNEHFHAFYVEGLQSIVSASEISEKAAAANGDVGNSPKLKEMLKSGSKIATEQTRTIRDILKKAGGQPGGQPDKVMQGISEAGKQMVMAAKDPQVQDAAVIATTQIGLHYYIAAYASLGSLAKRLGRHDDVKAFAEMNDHIITKDSEYAALRDEMATSAQ